MDLILWRHADAENERADLIDLDRALTAKGQRQAERMAAWLKPQLSHSTRILVSPALRCQQTAKWLGRVFETHAALAPGCDPVALLQVAGWSDAAEPVLVVGHQPTLGLVVAGLMPEWAEAGDFKKGAICWLRSNRSGEGRLQISLCAMQSPADL